MTKTGTGLNKYTPCTHRPHTSDFNCCDIVVVIVAAGARTRMRTTVFSHKHCFSYVMDCKVTALVCALLLLTRNVKKRKKFRLHPVMSQRLLKGKFYSLYEDLKVQQRKCLDISERLLQLSTLITN